MPTQSDFNPEKFTAESREAWTNSAPDYDKMSTALFNEFTNAFMVFSDIEPGLNVLDIACGPGLATFAAAERVGQGGKLTGVDLAPGMLAEARQKASAKSLHIEFKEMNAEKLDLPDDSFDQVICQLGLMLFSRPERALREMKRVVKKGGWVNCLVQGVPDKMMFTSLVMKAAVKHAPQLRVPGAPTLYTFGPAGVLEKAFTEAGLENVKSLRKEGLFTFPSAQAYWDTLTAGAGCLRTKLKDLSPEVVAAIKKDSLEAAQACAKNGRVEIPWEVVMAKGFKRR